MVSAFRNGPTRPDKLLAYHPIIVGDQVIVGDDTQVVAYNLNDRPDGPAGTLASGPKIAWRHDEDQGGAPQASRAPLGIPRYTLTAHTDRIYARMGLTTFPPMGRGMGMGMGGMGMGVSPPTYLIALDRATDGKLLWKKPPGEIAVSRKPGENVGRNLGFEGTPVADGAISMWR